LSNVGNGALASPSQLDAGRVPDTLVARLLNSVSLAVVFARSSFAIMLAHRVRYAIGIVNYITYCAVNYYLWDALYSTSPETPRAGYSLPEIQTYVCVNWIVRSAYFSNSDNILAARINKGEITTDLMRPTSLFLQFYGSAVGEAVFRIFFMALPVLALALWIFNIQPPANVLSGVLLSYSILLAFNIFFAVNFLTGLCAAYTEKLQGFLWAKFMLLQFMSGLLLPLNFFPPPLKKFFALLPFKGLADTPMNVYLGRYPPEQLRFELVLQTVWTVVLLLLCSWMWKTVRKRLSILGG
jgi:ABC-2 type transport system permease protein